MSFGNGRELSKFKVFCGIFIFSRLSPIAFLTCRNKKATHYKLFRNDMLRPQYCLFYYVFTRITQITRLISSPKIFYGFPLLKFPISLKADGEFQRFS